MESELQIAREIQQGLLPAEMPSKGWFRAAGSSLPATQVGGDYFDVRQITPALWASVVADVSGKGVSSALLASLLQGAFLMASAESVDIEGLLMRLNAFLLDRTRGEKYATMFYCTLDSSGHLRYANAGHCAPLLVGFNGAIRALDSSGMAVGMLEEAVFGTVDTQLSPGDKLVIYSDGLTETETHDGEFFGSERLLGFLREHSQESAADLHTSLLASVDRFGEGGVVHDDVTLLVLEYVPPA
jgi:serine phosphatase RsbU (regulator of sigma subunit)